MHNRVFAVIKFGGEGHQVGAYDEYVCHLDSVWDDPRLADIRCKEVLRDIAESSETSFDDGFETAKVLVCDTYTGEIRD